MNPHQNRDAIPRNMMNVSVNKYWRHTVTSPNYHTLKINLWLNQRACHILPLITDKMWGLLTLWYQVHYVCYHFYSLSHTVADFALYMYNLYRELSEQ